MTPANHMSMTGGNFIFRSEIRSDHFWFDEFHNLDAPKAVAGGSTLAMNDGGSITSLWLTAYCSRL